MAFLLSCILVEGHGHTLGNQLLLQHDKYYPIGRFYEYNLYPRHKSRFHAKPGGKESAP
jgi:hypothetical protein